MNITQSYLTLNKYYVAGTMLDIKGLMLHSVGCSQPKASVFIKNWNRSNVSKCAHAFIDGNTGGIYQTLPWAFKGAHAGKGSKGSANGTYIGVEMCEPSQIKYTGGSSFTCSDKAAAVTTAERTYRAAVELFAFLCKEFALDPMADGVIIGHAEGHQRGIASNHGDPEHIWRGLEMGYTMDTFRRDVQKAMGFQNASVTKSVCYVGQVNAADGLNMRSTPTSKDGSNIIKALAYRKWVVVMSDRSDGWSLVQDETGQQGYVYRKYLDKHTEGDFKRRKVLDATGLNIRASASTTGKLIATMPQSAVYMIMETLSNGWGLVWCGNTVGYSSLSNKYSKEV